MVSRMTDAHDPGPRDAAAETAGPSVATRALGVVGVPLRLALGGLFLWAGWIKISHPQDFVDAIKGYRLLPEDHLVVLTTFAVPWIEIVCAAALIVGFWTRAAAATIGLMLVTFMAAGVSVILRGIDVRCGCFGEQGLLCSGELGWCHIGENSLMLAAAALIVAGSRHYLAVENLFGRRGV